MDVEFIWQRDGPNVNSTLVESLQLQVNLNGPGKLLLLLVQG